MNAILAENLFATEPSNVPLNLPESSVSATLSFIERGDSKPSFESSALTGGDPVMHFGTEERLVPIRNMRPHAADFSLDREGFELRRHETAVRDLYDDRAIRQSYEREIKELLKAATGAADVAVFDHTRRSDSTTGATNPDGARRPAGRVHVDYTAASGPARAAAILGSSAYASIIRSGGRVAQVNMWRPIHGPVRRSPLALADAHSVASRDLIATDQIFPDRIGEIYHLAWARNQRWYWAPAMQPDEVLLIKGWDSETDGRARFTPHSAFRLPGQENETRPRESIETRCFLVFSSQRPAW